MLFLNVFLSGFSVSIEMKHLISGLRSSVSEYQIFEASLFILLTGLFAPSPLSANERSPMLIGSKKVVAADVARAVWQIVARMFGSSGRL